MNHLKKFESSEESFPFDITKDIIVDLKDNYPNLDGNFREADKFGGITLVLMCKGPDLETHIFKSKDTYSLEYFEEKNKFIILLTETLQRLKKALSRDIKVIDLYDFDSNSSSGEIKIYFMSK
jgi:hypothetical protein